MHRYIEGASIGILHDYITTAKNQSSDNRISMDIPDIRMFISVEFEVFGHVQGLIGSQRKDLPVVKLRNVFCKIQQLLTDWITRILQLDFKIYINIYVPPVKC
nr:uncharacterized protein LOC106622950 isoform X4 [Bactrocera oleae]